MRNWINVLVGIMLIVAAFACGGEPTVNVGLPDITINNPPAEESGGEPTMSVGFTKLPERSSYEGRRGQYTACGEIGVETSIESSGLVLEIATTHRGTGRGEKPFDQVELFIDGDATTQYGLVEDDGTVHFGQGERELRLEGAGEHILNLSCRLSHSARPGDWEFEIMSASGRNNDTTPATIVDPVVLEDRSTFTIAVRATIEFASYPTNEQGFIVGATGGVIARLITTSSDILVFDRGHAGIIMDVPYPQNWVQSATLRDSGNDRRISTHLGGTDLWFDGEEQYRMPAGTFEMDILLATGAVGARNHCYTLQFRDGQIEAKTVEGYPVTVPFVGRNTAVFCDRD